MARQLPLIAVHAIRDDRLLLWLFAKDCFADHAFDVGIRKLYLDSESGLESLKSGRLVAQRRLPSSDEKESLVQLGAAMLRDLL